MNTLNTDKKFTIILSAYQECNAPLQNLIDTELLFNHLEHDIHVHAIRAIGVYKGGHEQSFVVHTSSSAKLYQCRRYAYDAFNQECVLIRNNRAPYIKLHNSDGFNTLIGERFIYTIRKPSGADNFTVLNGKDFYTVL